VRPAVPYGSLYIRNEPSTGTLTAKPPTWYLRRFSPQDQVFGAVGIQELYAGPGQDQLTDFFVD